MTYNQNVEVGSNDIRQRAGHDLLHRQAVKAVQKPLRLLGSLQLAALIHLLGLVTLGGSASLLLRWCQVYVRKTEGGELALKDVFWSCYS